jgi:hypothetical protein
MECAFPFFICNIDHHPIVCCSSPCGHHVSSDPSVRFPHF